MEKGLHFEPLYPDVLGAIAGGLRIDIEPLQVAVGVFPRRAYINQPVEVIVIMQSQIDQPVDVRVALNLPSKDDDGSPVSLSTPKKQVSFTMSPGEAGVLRMPVVPIIPTLPAENLPIGVDIQARAARNGNMIRTPTRSAPPSVLAVSPFKVQVLRDVEFVDPSASSGTQVTALLDIAPRRMPSYSQSLRPTYEALWTRQQMSAERDHLLAQVDHARVIAGSFELNAVYPPILHTIDEVFATRGLPLHPGEAKAIAKMLAHTLDERTNLDPNYRIEETRWFQTLCQTLANNDAVAQRSPDEIVVRHLFEALLYDAILLGFALIRPRVRVNLGDRTERVHYANRVLRWLAGQLAPDLIYIYLPLVLGGVTVNHVITPRRDDPWVMLDELREAYRGRIRLVAGDAIEIFDMLDRLLERAENDLRLARIQRI